MGNITSRKANYSRQTNRHCATTGNDVVLLRLERSSLLNWFASCSWPMIDPIIRGQGQFKLAIPIPAHFNLFCQTNSICWKSAQQMAKPRHRNSTSCVDSLGRILKSPKLRKSSFYLLLLFLAILTCVDVFNLVWCASLLNNGGRNNIQVREYLEDNVDTDMYIGQFWRDNFLL